MTALLVTSTQVYSQCACCVGAGTGSSNGDYNNGILTLQKKQLVLEGYGDYRTIQEGEAHQHLHETSNSTVEETPLKDMFISSLGIRYGISDKITVSALLPYVFLNTNKGNDMGTGDLVLLGTVDLYSKNNFNLAIQAGLELPTGIQKGSNFDNSTVVVGSGSYDPMAGLAFSKRWDKLTLRGNGIFKYTTTGFEKNYYGSISVQNLSLSYRLKGENIFCSPDTTNPAATSDLSWNVFGGYYGEWLDKITEEEVVDENSGYYLGFTTLGTNLSYKKWSFPMTLSIPIIQNVNGDQNEAGYRFRIGIIKSF